MRRTGLVMAMTLLLGAMPGARAAIEASGGTGLRFERYEIGGDPAAVPWEHEGDHFHQEFDLRLAARPDAASRWELNTSGVVDHSGYRHAGQGLITEWLNFRYEDGGATLPYRIELGDQRVRFSPMTLDRRLQAARLELQPAFGGDGRHSVMWVSGRERTDWRTGQVLGNRYQGASWLVQDPELGRYAVNAVFQQAARPVPGTASGRLVTSIAAARDFSLWARQDVAAEAEWARVHGRVVAGGTPAGSGLRMQLRASDRTLPLDYEVRYRRHGEGFAPLGTTVERDSRELAANAGWRFPFGMGLRGRYDRNLRQASDQQLASEGYGLTVDLPRTLGWLEWMDQRWDLSRRFRENAWGSVDTRSTEARWSIRAAGGHGSSTRLALAWVGLEDRVSADGGGSEHRVSLSHARTFDLGFVDVAATPGVDYRVRAGADRGSVLNPTLRLDAARGPHRLGMRLDYRTLEAGVLAEREDYGLLLDYRYRHEQHTIGVEYEQLGRERDAAMAQAWRAGVFWRYRFDMRLGVGQ